MAQINVTNIFKSCLIVKDISYELYNNGMVYIEAKSRKDIAYAISIILEDNPTYKLNDEDIETVEGKAQAVVSFIETGHTGG